MVREAVRASGLAILLGALLAITSCRSRREAIAEAPPPGGQARASRAQRVAVRQPQVSGPTRARGWKYSTVVKGLRHPWGMAFLPDGGILITERPGRLRLVRNGKLVESPIEGVPEVLAEGQGGLLDLALHPDFQQNRLVYLTYAAGTTQSNWTTLARARLDGSQLRDLKVLLEVRPKKSGGEHFGSRLLWLPDKTLLMSIGDGGNPPRQIEGRLAREHAQRLDSLLGSLLRLKDDGSVPDDNPFVGRDKVRPEIYSYGHRNIQGLALDRASGRVWANEHGPLGGDELNLIRAGANFGWPRATHGADYRSGQRFTPHRSLPDAVSPKVVWTPATAPSGLAFYGGERFPDWQGSLFSGGLVTKDLRRISLDGDEATGQETIPLGKRVREVVEGPDGLLYVLTDEDDGELLRIEPA